MKQERKAGSLNCCMDELQQQTYDQKIGIGGRSSRIYWILKRTMTLKRRIICERKNTWRNSDTKYTRDGRNEESSRITSRRLLCTKIERESHETIQRLTSQMHEMQEQMNSGNFKKWNRITVGDCLPAAVPSSCSMLSRDKRLPIGSWNTSGLQENVFCNQFSTVDSFRNHYQRIHHSTTPGDTWSVPVHIGTRTSVARDEHLNRGTIPIPTFARRPSTMNSLFPVDIPQNSMVGQQRQQISELQFDKFPTLPHSYVGR